MLEFSSEKVSAALDGSDAYGTPFSNLSTLLYPIVFPEAQLDHLFLEVSEPVVQITAAIGDIQAHLTHQVKISEKTGKQATEIDTLANQNLVHIKALAQAIEKIQKLNQEKLLRMDRLELPNKVLLMAQSDHLLWKKKLYDAF
jgi:uncharacterized protein (DUF1919 family)